MVNYRTELVQPRGSTRELVLESVRFPGAMSWRYATRKAAEAIRHHDDATGAVLIEDPALRDTVHGFDIVLRLARAARTDPPSRLTEVVQAAAAAYQAEVVGPREALREQRAAERQRKPLATETETDTATPQPLTEEQIEAAARSEATQHAILYPVQRTAQVALGKMNARERRADNRAKAAEQEQRTAEVLAATKARLLAERDGISDRPPSCTRCGVELIAPVTWFPSYEVRDMHRCKTCATTRRAKEIV